MITVPWLPWLEQHEEVPGEVMLVLYLILAISCQKGVVTGSALLQELSRRTGMDEESLVFFVHMAMEVGLLGGIDIATGSAVTVQHVTAAEAAAADPSMN